MVITLHVVKHAGFMHPMICLGLLQKDKISCVCRHIVYMAGNWPIMRSKNKHAAAAPVAAPWSLFLSKSTSMSSR